VILPAQLRASRRDFLAAACNAESDVLVGIIRRLGEARERCWLAVAGGKMADLQDL
jgi:hypothetical protein